MAVAQVVGATGQFEDCCEGRLLGRDHSPDCPRLLAIQFTPTSRDEEIAMALQAAELQNSPEQVEMAPGPVTYSMVDPVWGEVLKQEPSCAFRCCFSCCPCCVIGCRTPEAKKAWRRFLFSMSFMLSMVQVMILVVVIALDGGFVSYEDNPMLGPHFHRLDAAGAKNAAKIANGEVWRLASATMLHAGWIHLVGNILVQIRAGVQLEIIWGTPAWLLIYFSSGIYANFLSCVLHPGALGVGSSGCLCGLIGGWLSFLLITWNQTMPPSSDYEAELVMKVLGLNGNNHASRTIYLDGESGDEMSESDDGVGTYVDGPTKSLKKTKKKKRSKRKTTPVAAGEELDDDDDYEQSIREGEMDIKLDKEKADDVEVVDGPPLPPPDGEPPYDGPEHHSMGKPGDGIIYLSDIGEHVKLDKRGRPYRVGPDGRKEVRGSPRPKSSYSPEEWRALSAKERDVIIRRGKLEEEAEKLKEIKLKKEKEKKAKAEISEKKKHDSSSSKDPAKDESRKKKKKDNKKSKESSGKDGGKDAAVNVGTLRGRNPWECSPTPHGASDLDDIKKREKDELAGKFRFGKTILITDLNYKCQANSGGTTNIQYGLDEMGYVVTVVDINSFKSVTRAQKFLDAVEHLIKSVMPNITAEENVTIHFWISFAFLITDTHPYHVWVERNYAERLAEAIRRVDKLATRPIFVSLCKDPRFHGIRTGIQEVAIDSADIL
ncbi:unnamed protein product, partial [Cladocopium goreaui]